MAGIILREVFRDVEKHLTQKQITVITGIRRAGKTTLAKYLFNGLETRNKIFLDLENTGNRHMFMQSNYDNIIKSLAMLGLNFSENAYLFIDEIQLLPSITSVIKYLYDHHTIKFVVTGSSSFYLKNHFSESLSGRKKIFILDTLSFSEFLLFKDVRYALPNPSLEYINDDMYNRLLYEYEEYLLYGGFPEVVLAGDPKIKHDLLQDIINSYLHLDIKFLSDFSRRDEIFKISKLLSARVGSKADFTKLGSITGINRKLMKEYLLFFEETFLLKQISAYVKNPDREVALHKKFYFSDNGILSGLGVSDRGKLLENSVFNQLSRMGELKYYAAFTGHEIDFILNNKIAFEVKETPSEYDLRALRKRCESIGIKKYYLTGLTKTNPDFDRFVWAGSI